jgi:dihydroorotase
MELLQNALKNGEVDLLTTLHRPNSPVNKEVAFADASYGCEGITEALPLYYTKLVKTGLIDMPSLSALTSQASARLLRKNRGMIAPGMDADLVVFDPDAATTVDNSQSLFDGEVLCGAVTMAFKRGHRILG